IESVLSQTLPADEIIVVDDGSRDRTSDVAMAFGSQVRLIRIENTGVGPSRPRNVGFGAATSRYVALLDSDDVLLPTLLERTRDLIAQAPGIGLVFNMSFLAPRTPEGRDQRVRREYRGLLAGCSMSPSGPDAFVINSRNAFSTYCKGNYIGTTGATVLK